MAVHRIKKGLDLPLAGAPAPGIQDGPEITRVAVLGDDTFGLRARLAVEEGQTVKRGQLLFEDRLRPGVRYTAPGAGRVKAIFRGAKRRLQSIVIDLSSGERDGSPAAGELEPFATHPGGAPEDWTGDQLRRLLIESGMWTALRTRPFSKIPEPDAEPQALFVTAIDTNPHAPDPDAVVEAALEDFQLGLRLVAKLCDGPTYLCIAKDSSIRGGVDSPADVEIFDGPHPAGNPGVHIHRLAPVSRNRSVWHIGYQDVIAIGQLAVTGRLPVERVVSLGGPPLRNPRSVRTRLGASVDELLADDVDESGGEVRVISGSVLSGKKAMGPEFGYLGRYHQQVSVLRTGGRRFLGWIDPGPNKFSFLPVFVSRLLFKEDFALDTDTNGSERPIFPLGTYELVMPMDILATYLLRALAVGDLEQAVALGALELDEEDLSLCTFVCPGKTEFGPYLRRNLELIEKEG